MIRSLASFSILQKSKCVRGGGRRAIQVVKVSEPPSLYRYEYEGAPNENDYHLGCDTYCRINSFIFILGVDKRGFF